MKLLLKDAWQKAARLLLAGLLLLGGLKGGVVFAQEVGSTISPAAKGAYIRGVAAAGQKDWELAIKYFGQAREAAPTWPDALYNLAYSHQQAGGRELIAIAWYQAYLAAAPNADDADQVRAWIAELEVKVEVRVRKLIRKVKEASPARFMFLQASSLAWLGDIAGAKEVASRVPPRGGYTKSLINKVIATEQVGGGDIVGATLSAAQIPEDWAYENQSLAYWEIAWAQANAGDFTGAMETASRIKRDREKFSAYQHTAFQQAEAGDITGARGSIARAQETAARMEEGTLGGRSSAYADVVEVQAKAGDIAGAKKVASQITDETYKSMAYEHIVEAQARTGDIAGAKETAARFIPESDKSKAYIEIAKAQTKTGDTTGARESIARALKGAARITSDWSKGNAYIEIAEGQAEMGDITGARKSVARAQEAAARIEKDIMSIPSSVYRDIVKAQVKAGDIAGAKETAASITDKNYKKWAFQFIARVQLKEAEEIESWTDLAEGFSKSPVKDWQGFLEELEGKEPGKVVESLANAANDMAWGLRKLRNMEAKWQKRRAGAAK